MTLSELFKWGRSKLAAAEIPDADYDAFRLLEYVTGCSHAALITDGGRSVFEEQVRQYWELTDSRASRIPLQHLIGEQEFMGLPFEVSGDVLIPRADTEILVETALEKSRSLSDDRKNAGILDLGCGSGCILISLIHYLRTESQTGGRWRGVGSDISEKALLVAERNARRNQVDDAIEWVKSDLFQGLQSDRFALIVSNPPYIPASQIKDLQPEVRDHDPVLALDGGSDGLDFYRRITEQAPDHLTEGGWLIVEIGFDQREEVTEMFAANGFQDIESRQDLAGLNRVIAGHL